MWYTRLLKYHNEGRLQKVETAKKFYSEHSIVHRLQNILDETYKKYKKMGLKSRRRKHRIFDDVSDAPKGPDVFKNFGLLRRK